MIFGAAARFSMRVLAMALVFGLNSAAVIAESQLTGGMAAVWIANALFLTTLLLTPVRNHLGYAIGAFAASIAANLYSGIGWPASITFSIANIVEAWFGFQAMRLAGITPANLIRPGMLLRFVGIAALAAAVSASVAVPGLAGSRVTPWLSWFLSDTLGLVMIVPCAIVLRDFWRDPARSIRMRDLTGCSALILGVTTIAFAQASVPLAFLVTLPVLVAVFRLGPIGAVIAIAEVAVITIVLSVRGNGPFAAWDASQINQMFLLQGFVAAQMMIALSVSSLLADRTRAAAQALETERKLRLVAESSKRLAEINARRLAITSATDELTGLSSRRRVMEKLATLMGRARRHGQSLAIVLFDVDFFKQINDGYGHAAGDEALATIGRIARATVPARFPIGRIGGEEFLIVLHDLPRADVVALTERLRIAIMQGAVVGGERAITISAGIAHADSSGDFERLLFSADVALYRAKAGGRNQHLMAA